VTTIIPIDKAQAALVEQRMLATASGWVADVPSEAVEPKVISTIFSSGLLGSSNIFGPTLYGCAINGKQTGNFVDALFLARLRGWAPLPPNPHGRAPYGLGDGNTLELPATGAQPPGGGTAARFCRRPRAARARAGRFISHIPSRRAGNPHKAAVAWLSHRFDAAVRACPAQARGASFARPVASANPEIRAGGGAPVRRDDWLRGVG
jgi:hypothetical protein